MPTYQYACTECGHSFEQFQSFSDDSLEHCPVCQGRLRKVFNAVGVVFKGSGFYRNDSRAASSSTLPGDGAKTKESSSDSSGSSESSGSSDSSGASGSSGEPSSSSSSPSSAKPAAKPASSAPPSD